jgi:hypothetical protein
MFGWRMEEEAKIEFTITVNWHREDGSIATTQVGVSLMNRTAPPPKLDAAGQAAFIKKALELAPKYRTELLKPE